MKMKCLLVMLLFVGLATATTVTLNESNVGNIGDSYVNQNVPGANYGTTTSMYTAGGYTNYGYRSFIMFNLSNVIPYGAIVTDANLSLYVVQKVVATSRTFQAYNTTANWTENTTGTGITWNSQPSAGTLQGTIATGTTADVWLSWNVTPAVSALISTAYPQNLSIEIKDETETGSTLIGGFFATKENAASETRPQLYVTYTMPACNQTGLVGYWKLDEDTGTYAYDSSGCGGNTGTLVNSPTWTTGKNYQTPYALSYDGVNQHVNVPSSSSLNGSFGQSFSVCYWFNANQARVQGLVMKSSGGLGWRFFMRDAVGGYVIEFDATNSTNSEIGNIIAGNVTTGVWHHVCGVFDGAGQTVSIYLNGVYQSGSGSIASMSFNNPSQLLIASPAISYFNGTIDEVKIWNRTLSASQVMSEFTNYCPLNPVSIIAFNESQSSQSLSAVGIVASNTTSTFNFPSGGASFTDYYCNSTFPTGSVTISISNSSFYSPRYYYSTITYGGSYGLNAYLLPLSDLYEISTTILVSNGIGGVVPGALVSIYKDFGSGNTIVAQDIADGVGQTRFNLDAQTSYLLIATASGYSQVSLSFQPSQPIYTITLQNTNATAPLFNCSSCGVTWNMTPMGYLVTGNVNFNFSVYDYYNDLSWWGMNVSYNGTSQYFTNQTATSGGSVNYTMNTSNVLGNSINVTIFFYRNGTFFDPTYYYTGYTFTAGNASLANALAAVGASGLSQLTKGILVVVLITCIAGYVGTTMSLGGGVIIELVGLWFFFSIGFVGFLPLLTLTMLGLAVVYNRLFALTPAG